MTTARSFKRMMTIWVFLGAMVLVSIFSNPVSANHTCGVEPLGTCGDMSGLIPTHKDAVSSSLVWGSKSDCPKMLIWMRPSEYTAQQFLSPPVGDGSTFPGFNQTYINLVQGGFNLGGLDRSGWSRYPPDVNKENAQLMDICGLQSLIDTGIFTKMTFQEITNADMALTEPFLTNAGYSRGMNYNLFCAGNAAGADGRLYIVGGHDKGGNNGIKKINIYDPVTERWVPRPVPCVKSEFEADPTGTAFPHCSARDENNTDPPDPSDMKYQRWYNSAVTLPDGRIMGLHGQDRDTSGGPGMALFTTVSQAVPEVYDPRTDRNIALENAKKDFIMFPRAFPTQMGPKKDDWKLCMTGVRSPWDSSTPQNQRVSYDPFRANGETWCLDVRGALADPARDIPASNHWQYIATTQDGAHYAGAGVRMVTVNENGTYSQKAFSFGGNSGYQTPPVATAEMIDFSSPAPAWVKMDDLDMAVNDNNVVPMPDGKLLVVGGGIVVNGQKHLMIYDPVTGRKENTLELAVFRGDHATVFVVPSGGVWIMGGNRVDFLPGLQNDVAVSTMQYYRPSYFFKGPRPVITKTPYKVHHGDNFQIEVSTPGESIESVVLLRTGPITHSWAWGSDSVKLPVKGKKEKEKNHKHKGKDKNKKEKLHVKIPSLPALAIAGDYIMFAVSEDGIPSEGKHIFVSLDKRKHMGKDRDDDDDRGRNRDDDDDDDRGRGRGAALKEKNMPKATKDLPPVGPLTMGKPSVVPTGVAAIR